MTDESPTLHSYGDRALKDVIEKNAQGPKSARGDRTSPRLRREDAGEGGRLAVRGGLLQVGQVLDDLGELGAQHLGPVLALLDAPRQWAGEIGP